MTAPYDCIKCGAKHGMVIHNNLTDQDTPLDMCYDCIFSGVKYNPLPDHIKVDELMNISTEQMRLKLLKSEAELIEAGGEWLNLTVSTLKQVTEWLEKKKEKYLNESR